MKTKHLAAMLAVAGATVCAGQSAAAQKARVIVCMKPDQSVLMGVRPLASSMFARIGVRIEWRDSCPVGAGAVQIRLSHDSPNIRSSEALGFSLPYQGTAVVFLDRVKALNRDGVRSILAHVLVHEITHVLEGIDRHSTTGVMKARWNDHDFDEMRQKPLSFAQEDINLIHIALDASRVSSGLPFAGGIARR